MEREVVADGVLKTEDAALSATLVLEAPPPMAPRRSALGFVSHNLACWQLLGLSARPPRQPEPPSPLSSRDRDWGCS